MSTPASKQAAEKLATILGTTSKLFAGMRQIFNVAGLPEALSYLKSATGISFPMFAQDDAGNTIGPLGPDGTRQAWLDRHEADHAAMDNLVKFQRNQLTGGKRISGIQASAVRAENQRSLIGTAAVLGDSRGAFGFSYASDGRAQYTRTRGAVHWLNYYLGGPWSFEQVSIDAVSGERSDQWSDGHAELMARQIPVDFLYITFPTNDVLQGIDPATTIEIINGYIDAHLARGTRVILGTSGGTGSAVAAQKQAFCTINKWLANKADGTGCILLDLASPVADPATGAFASGMTYDTTHENAVGCHAQGFYNAPRFAAFAHRRSVFQRLGVWDQAAYNPTMSGTLVSNAPPGWIVNYGTTGGQAATHSKQTRTDIPGEYYRCVFTSAADTDFAGATQTIALTTAWATGSKAVGARVRGSYGDHWVCTTAGTASGTEPPAMAAASIPGDACTDSGGVVWTRIKTIVPGVSKITIFAEIKISNAGGSIPRLRCDFTGATGPVQALYGLIPTDGTDALPVIGNPITDIVPAVSSPAMIVPADCTALSLRVYGQAANGSTATVDIGRVIIDVE